MSTKSEYQKKRRAELIAAGKCSDCGKPREPMASGGGGATRVRCHACAERIRNNTRNAYRSRTAAGKCSVCGKPCQPKWIGGKKPSRCAECARVRRANDRDLRAKEPGYQPVFGPPPTEKPRYVGRAAKPIGPAKPIGFTLNKSTLEAIDELKRRYKEAHSGESWKDHVSEILRDAVTGVLRNDGPFCTERERLCVPGWQYTLRFPIAQYEQITRIANERFGGSRAAAVRVAIYQAAHWPFRVTYGPKKLPYAFQPHYVSPRDPWDDD